MSCQQKNPQAPPAVIPGPGERYAGDMRAAFDSSNPRPLEYLELASECLDLARRCVRTNQPVGAVTWLRAARAALVTGYKLQELVDR